MAELLGMRGSSFSCDAIHKKSPWFVQLIMILIARKYLIETTYFIFQWNFANLGHEGCKRLLFASAAIAQLGERQTEDLKVPGSIPGLGTFPTPAKTFIC